MLLLVFLTDFAKISLSTDNVRQSKKPETWNNGSFITVSVVLGVAMVAETLLLLWIGWAKFGVATDDNALYTYSFLMLLYFAVFSVVSMVLGDPAEQDISVCPLCGCRHIACSMLTAATPSDKPAHVQHCGALYGFGGADPDKGGDCYCIMQFVTIVLSPVRIGLTSQLFLQNLCCSSLSSPLGI